MLQELTIEQQLKESELFYRNLIADSLDGILLTDENAIISFSSPSVTKILGYESEDIGGKNVFDYVHPDDRFFAASAFFDEVKMSPRVKFVNIRLRKKDGTWLWTNVRGHNMLRNPHIGRIAIYFFDDTLRKKAEDALIESEKKFRRQATILNNVTDIIVTTDLNRVITSWNKVIEKLSGITATEAVGKRFRETIDADYSPYTHDQVAEIVFEYGIWRGEISFTGIDGEKKYLLHTVSFLQDDTGKKIGLLGVGKDITERKKAQERLQESELFYRSLISHSLDGIVMTDKEGRITYCGPSAKKISGYEPEQLLGQHILAFVHPDDISAAAEVFTLEINKQSAVNYIHVRLRHSNNNWVWCVVRGRNLLSQHPFNGLVIYFTDDSKRKEIEEKLSSSEEQFRALIHNLSQGVVLLNEKAEIVITNKAALDILGLSEAQLLGTKLEDSRRNVINENGQFLSSDQYPGIVAMRTKKEVRNVVMGIFRESTNERIWLLVNADPTIDESGNIINVIVSFTDISEQRKLSRQLIEQEIQKQKQLTQATIFGQEKERQEIGKELHDNINQHLNTTRLYLEVAKEKASGEILEMINLSHKSLTAMINEIRVLSQSLVPPTLGDLGLVESVQELCDSLRRAHKFNIDFYYRHFSEEELPGNLRLMLFRIVQEQINNIIRHANANNVQIKLQTDAENLILTIADDGNGFDLSTNKKGLGLSNIANRADLFNGKVDIETAPGMGCLIAVVIPLPEN